MFQKLILQKGLLKIGQRYQLNLFFPQLYILIEFTNTINEIYYFKPKRTQENVEVNQKDYSSSDDEPGATNESSDSESDLPLKQRICS